MKYNVYMMTLVAGSLMASCADEFDQAVSVKCPDSIARMAYLSEYAPLKEYVSSSSFKLGAALDVNEFNNGGAVKSVVMSNFTEVVAGNAMKMGSIVKDDGTMNFDAVETFVEKATEANLSVYGHTLAWHAQQPNKWLNSLVADKPAPSDPDAKEFFLNVTGIAGKADGNPWDQELYYDFDEPLKGGSKYHVKVKITGPDCDITFWPGMKDGSNTQYGAPGLKAGKDGYENDVIFNPGADVDRLRFCMGKVAGDFKFDDLSVILDGTETELVENGSFDEPSVARWTKPSWHNFGIERGSEAKSTNVMIEKEIVEKRNCFKVSSLDMVKDPWETQMWFMTSGYKSGDSFKLTADVRATRSGSVDSQIHTEPGTYVHWQAVGNMNFSTDWEHITLEGTFPMNGENSVSGNSVAFNLNAIAKATDFYLDNVSFLINGVEQMKDGDAENGAESNEGIMIKEAVNGKIVPIHVVNEIRMKVMVSSNTIPQTPEEMHDTLVYAMNKWVGGMMEATKGKVKAWDVVNEAVSGADADGDGYYDLQHGAEGGNDFFWQDYLGDLDYVRVAVAAAREKFVANGGQAADLKLFINDYNLESTWDDNKKLKSLINWIGKWEADGVTKIDGIGSQMHINCFEKPESQKAQEDAVVKMLELMAATGKLCRISELDMGYKDASGQTLIAAELTEEQHKAMAKFYSFIVTKYLEIIPAAQQWGICQWCLTDSPATSSWRKNEPTGLWDLKYNRKHTYAGFAEGLQKNQYTK